MSEGITFKGSVNCLTIKMNESDEFDNILEQINKKIDSAGKFFKGASLEIKYLGKKLNEMQENKILELLAQKSGAQIKGISQGVESAEVVQPEANKSKENREAVLADKKINENSDDESMTKFFKGTVRSGGRINYNGNVIIMGDVNPGGEVIASGNIVVLGSLRGIVHAGANGNKEAVIFALSLYPTQIRIADVITRSPDGKNVKNQCIPEVAYVKDNTIIIDKYSLTK